jgi:hypothetical protein
MPNDEQISPAARIVWPSMAAASAELCRPRSSRAGRVENPAVLRLVQPAAQTSVVDLGAPRRYALRRHGR